MLAVTTYLWNRPAIESIVLDYYADLRDRDVLPVELKLAAGYSRETPLALRQQGLARGWTLYNCPSAPLSRKLNEANRQLGADPAFADATHLLTFGSDDLIHPEALRILWDAAQDHAAVGFAGAFFLDVQRWRAAHMPYPPNYVHRPCGAGRMLRREVLERLRWMPRADNRNRGMDSSMDKRLRSIGVHWKVLDYKSIATPVLDVKTGQNLSKFTTLLRYGARHVDPEFVVNAFGEPWSSRLRALGPPPSSSGEGGEPAPRRRRQFL